MLNIYPYWFILMGLLLEAIKLCYQIYLVKTKPMGVIDKPNGMSLCICHPVNISSCEGACGNNPSAPSL